MDRHTKDEIMRNGEFRDRPRPKRKKSKFRIFLRIVSIILFICLLTVGVYINYLFSKLNYEPEDENLYKNHVEGVFDPNSEEDPFYKDSGNYSDTPKFNREAPYDKNIINILLIGADRYPNDKSNGRSDSMIIATLDKKHKEIKLTSIMRDTYVYIPGYRDHKINVAYSKGNAPYLIETINANFNLRLSKYVVVDFKIFSDVIDKLGGVEVELKDYEVKYLKNRHEAGPNRHNLKDGKNLLDGKLALEYARTRSVGHADYERTDRQRNLLTALYKKMINLDFFALNRILADILPMVRTNLTKGEVLSLLFSVVTMKQSEVQQLRIPAKGTFSEERKDVGAVLVPDLQANADKIREFIYKD